MSVCAPESRLAALEAQVAALGERLSKGLEELQRVQRASSAATEVGDVRCSDILYAIIYITKASFAGLELPRLLNEVKI